MTTFNIVWTEPARKQLRALDHPVARRIVAKVDLLAEAPHRHVTRLTASGFYRLRVGDYRVIVDIQGETLVILVLKVGHRRSIYER